MTTKARRMRKKNRKWGSFQLILLLILGVLVLWAYKQLSTGTQNMHKTGQGSTVSGASSGYTVISMDSTNLAVGDLVLVDKEHPYSFPGSLGLVSIYDRKNDAYFVRDKNVLLDKTIMERLNDLMAAFSAATSLSDVNVVAGYRTVDAQQKLYNDGLVTKGHEHTAQYIALPGCSEHHTGLAVDFAIFHSTTGDSAEFNGTGDYGWIAAHAWEYGFVQRFSASKTSVTDVAEEPWHFRYVGIPHAWYMQQNDLCLEEYIDLLHQYPFDAAHLSVECFGQKYDVYFCAGLDVLVPETGDYKVSGNNADGFIVTVTIQ